MKKIFLLLVGLTSLGLTASAQQEPHFTMFMFNRQNINPGYTGSNGGSNFEFIGRKQWVDIKGAPSTFAASYSTPLGNSSSMPHSAIGVSFYSDRVGVSNNNYVALQYAYRALLNEETVLSMGIQGSFLNMNRTFSDLNPYESGDGTLNSSENQSANLGNVGAGLYLYHERYYVGVGIPNLLKQNAFDGTDEEVNRHMYAMAGHIFNLSSSLVLRPAVLLKYAVEGDRRSPLSTDVNLSAIWNNKFMFGLSYRVQESLDAMMKVRLSENFYLGYAYDFGLEGIADYSDGSHEFMFGFNWGIRTKSVNHPRFINYF